MKYLILLFLVFCLLSCNKKTHKNDFKDIYPNEYNSSVRWKRFEYLKKFLDKEDYKTLNSIKKKYKDSTINSYRILLIKKIKEDKYKVVVEREEVISPSNILKINHYIQFWIYDLKKKNWKIEQEIPDKE